VADSFNGMVVDPEEGSRVGKGWKILGGDYFMDDLGQMISERFKEQGGLSVLCGCEDFCVAYLGADKKIAKIESEVQQ